MEVYLGAVTMCTLLSNCDTILFSVTPAATHSQSKYKYMLQHTLIQFYVRFLELVGHFGIY